MTRKTTIITTIAFFAIIVLIAGFATFAVNAHVNNAANKLYPLNTVVQEINEETDTVTCADYNGNLWEFYGVEDWQEGDFATMIMDTCGTTNIFDDEIVKVEYNGNVEGLF